MPSKEILELLKELGLEVKSASASVDEETAAAIAGLVDERKRGKEETKKVRLPNRPILITDLAAQIGRDLSTIVKAMATTGKVWPMHEPLPLEDVILLLKQLNIAVEVVVTPEPTPLPTIPMEPTDGKPGVQEGEVTVAASTGTLVATKRRRPVPPDYCESRAIARPPIITVMGHVDHGKTTLLDAIRKTNLAEREVGQITQHIGAYEVDWRGQKITFIDTPGHEAFTALRARGAEITDIVILVVAAEDGVMPQTVEAINHARAAEVPVIVAVNKMDKPTANYDRVVAQIAGHGLIPCDYGGEVSCVKISALKGENIDHLLQETIRQAERLNLKADPQARLFGYVLETKMDPRRGPLATIIVEHGTLREGDWIVAGRTYGRVKQMTDWRGEKVREAGPAKPVSVLGLEDLPEAGDLVEGVPDGRVAREKALERQRSEEIPGRPQVTLENFFAQAGEGQGPELKLIVKADVQGSLEAITTALERLQHPEVTVRIIHKGVGPVTESDIDLARASGAVVLGFSVRLEPTAKAVLQRDPVDVRLYQVIYDLIDDVKKAIVGQLKPRVREEILGVAEVRATFRILRFGVVAGCFVQKGRVTLGSSCRVIRNQQVLATSRVVSLRHFKEDRTQISEGMECGIALEDFSDFQPGDLIEVFRIVQEERTVQEIQEKKIAAPVAR